MNIRIAFAALALCAMAVASAAAENAPAKKPMTSWDAQKDGSPKSYVMGGYTLTLSSTGDAQNPTPTFGVKAEGVAPATMKGQAGFTNAQAEFGVAHLDPKTATNQIIFSTYSGGAHCCFEPLVLEQQAGKWATIDLGSWDGSGLGYLPEDVDGDGVPDFVMADNAFLYAFDCYACSAAPPLILNIIGSKVVNVSKDARFAPLYRDNMAQTKQGCAEHNNGVCAGYVADAARLGKAEFDAAWTFMLANYKKDTDWTYPGHCHGAQIDGQCKGTEEKPKDFPQSLRWFLEDQGYLPKAG